MPYYLCEENHLKQYLEQKNQITSYCSRNEADEKIKTDAFRNDRVFALLEEVEGDVNFQVPDFYNFKDGTAYINVAGTMVNQISYLDYYWAGRTLTTYGFIKTALGAAEKDGKVERIVFLIDTHGGELNNCNSTADMIYNSTKPTIAYCSNMCASAGYFLASQTNQVISADEMCFFGSIGVCQVWVSREEAFTRMGIEIFTIVNKNSPDKKIDITTEHGRKLVTNELDDAFTVFLDKVSRGRNVDHSTVLSTYGKGGILIAENSLNVGMIDTISEERTTGFPVIPGNSTIKRFNQGEKKMRTPDETGNINARLDALSKETSELAKTVGTLVSSLTQNNVGNHTSQATAENHTKQADETKHLSADETKRLSAVSKIIRSGAYNKNSAVMNVISTYLDNPDKINYAFIQHTIDLMDQKAVEKDHLETVEEQKRDIKTNPNIKNSSPNFDGKEGINNVKELSAFVDSIMPKTSQEERTA